MEMVLVISLLSIVGAFTFFVMRPSVDLSRLDAATKVVASDIEFAKASARASGQTSGVSFVQNGAYTVYEGSTATPLKSPLTLQDLIVTLSSTFPGISISNSFIVEFNAFGAPTTGGGGSVTLTNGTDTKTISVTANTGRVGIN